MGYIIQVISIIVLIQLLYNNFYLFMNYNKYLILIINFSILNFKKFLINFINTFFHHYIDII